MDKKHFELLYRATPFCRALLSEAWDDLGTTERISLLLHFDQASSSISEELFKKAIDESSAIIRMLAVKNYYVSEQDDPDLYKKILSDESPFVRAAIKGGSFFIDFEEIKQLSHIEKLGFLALTDFISEESFGEFIVDGLDNKTLSEDEAAELVIEVVRNPRLTQHLDREPMDGLDWYTINKNFEAIWNLTTCTHKRVHGVIAWEYPLNTTDYDTIPDEMLDRMSDYALEALAYRQHKPLLQQIEKNPKKFSEEVVKSAQSGNELGVSSKTKAYSEIDELRQELTTFQKEVFDRIDDLSQQISDIASKKRGFFS